MSGAALSVTATVGLALGGILGFLTASDDQTSGAQVPSAVAVPSSETSTTAAPTTAQATERPATTSLPATTSQMTTTSEAGCSDGYESWNWPATTQGPIIECPESPYGEPRTALTRPSANGWIAVLESIEVWNVDQVDPRADQLGQRDEVMLLDSRQYLELRDPYWVLYSGPYDSRDAASAFCANRRYLDPCYPRELG